MEQPQQVAHRWSQLAEDESARYRGAIANIGGCVTDSVAASVRLVDTPIAAKPPTVRISDEDSELYSVNSEESLQYVQWEPVTGSRALDMSYAAAFVKIAMGEITQGIASTDNTSFRPGNRRLLVRVQLVSSRALRAPWPPIGSSLLQYLEVTTPVEVVTIASDTESEESEIIGSSSQVASTRVELEEMD
ncbi:unnamed protein product [Symbiodinium sp. CCMP2592]|nr:unnamed protein product [Symbiodinium sp. CCMP2592]